MQFTGTVQTVNEKGNETIFTVKSSDARCARAKYGRVLCVTNNCDVMKSLPARFVGTVRGATVLVTSVTPIWIDEKKTLNFLCQKTGGLVKRSFLQKVIAVYGKDLFSMKQEDFLERACNDFPNNRDILPELSKKIFCPINPLSDLQKLFAGKRVDRKTLTIIYENYGEEKAVENVKKDPYRICLDCGIPIGVADQIANAEEWKNTDRRRIEGTIRYALSHAEKNGHTYVTGKKLLSVLPQMNARSFDSIVLPVTPLHIANALSESHEFAISDDGHISFSKTKKQEEFLARTFLTKTQTFDQVTEKDIDDIEHELGVTFGEEQRRAFFALNAQISVLTGAPGTGKTMVTNGILRLYQKKNPNANLTLCAPTGRAAKRLMESTGQLAQTVHKTLGLVPGEHAKEEHLQFNQAHPLQSDLIVVDESSMLDTELLFDICQAMKQNTRLLLIGDEDQLPSVGCGNCLHDIIASNLVPVFRLTEIYRQKKGSGIAFAAKDCIKGIRPNPSDDFSIIEVNSEKEMQERLVKEFIKRYDEKNPYNIQIIEPTNQSVQETNTLIHTDVFQRPKGAIVCGDKVMFTRNVYDPIKPEQSYVNGELGVCDSTMKLGLSIFSEDEEEKLVSEENKTDVRLAYACTVHKFQGSEADTILIGLPLSATRMMNRNLLYTAITRARKKVVIVVVKDEFYEDILTQCVTKNAPKRNTRLLNLMKKGE